MGDGQPPLRNRPGQYVSEERWGGQGTLCAGVAFGALTDLLEGRG